jgi:hypothetical protein
MGDGLNTLTWFDNLPRNKWISIDTIPGEIFWSVWDIIDRNGFKRQTGAFEVRTCIMDIDNRQFKILS